MNLYQKLAAIRETVEVMQRTTKAFSYFYVSDVDLLAKISVGMKENHVSLIPKIVPGTTTITPYRYDKTKTDKAGKVIQDTTVYTSEVLVSADMIFVWINDENPEEQIEVPWSMTGQQADASQAFGSGLTYSYRYFLLKYFGVATPNDDPDNWRSKQQEVEQERQRKAAEESEKELAEKRKEITALGKKAIAGGVDKANVRETIAKLNNGSGATSDIKDVAVADAVIDALKKLGTKPKKKKETETKAEA